MEPTGEEGEQADGRSYRPVSSLRSHFENIIKTKPVVDKPSALPSAPTAGAPPVVPPRPGRSSANVNLLALTPRGPGGVAAAGEGGHRGRVSLDLPRSNASQNPNHASDQMAMAYEHGGEKPGTPRSRPLSMGPLTPALAPPTVMIESPRSPPRYSQGQPRAASSSRGESPVGDGARSVSPLPPPTRGFKLPTRGLNQSLDSTPQAQLGHLSQGSPTPDPKKLDMASRAPVTASSFTSGPPPINRAIKPRAYATPTPRKGSETLAAPMSSSTDHEEDKISPFSTPPSEPELDSPSPPPIEIPPPIPEASKPRAPPQLPARDNRFASLPIRDMIDPPVSTPVKMPPPMPPRHPAERLDAPPPSLPPRPDAFSPPPIRNRSPRAPPPPPELPRRSMDQQPPPPSRADMAARVRQPETRVLIPTRRPNTANTQPSVTNFPPPPQPPGRASADMKRDPQVDGTQRYNRSRPVDSDEEEEPSEHSPERPATGSSLYHEAPNESQANRRPPRYTRNLYPPEINLKQTHETRLFVMSGDRLCTSGLQTTKGWNTKTGDLLFTFTHGEVVKATALAFKPGGVGRAKEGENGEHEAEDEGEGRRIWVGTSTGDLQEIDVATKTVVASRREVHGKSTIVKILRCVSDLLTLDDEGKVFIWPAEAETGTPRLDASPYSARVVPKAGFALMVGTQMWVAMGKGIWVYEYDRKQRTLTQMTKQPLVQSGVGDVTTGATVAVGQKPADRVYFGHGGVDGKVSIYSRESGYQCLGVVPVSLYPIRALVGVGDKLWAGFRTGKVYVYDVSTQPWKVVKDWKAHEDSVLGLQVDHRSVWRRTGKRLPVASMGKDGCVRFWDGMLTDDWLASDLQEHDVEYCDFGEFTAGVFTWNAGASKPSSLRQDQSDDNFFREYLTSSSEPPDMLVFGFQELVDLEDKKVTAKSFFKAAAHKKHKDKHKDDGFHHHPDTERMSHQYRAWRDHLARCIDENMPSPETYQLLHTANLVGLFTCIFVKDSFRGRISDLEAAEIKLGMGGLHGNKGALVVRFLVDGSSVCLLNCHLAAGQSNTGHRNKDLAVIMDAQCLSARGNEIGAPLDAFSAGTDGTMILDHEICILAGDLNYRIDSIPRDAIVAAVKANNLPTLLARDQLLGARRRNAGHRLRGWEEKPIAFAPTYKYDVGTDTYDTSEKRRAPAWCDRILYRGLGKVRMDVYRRWEAPRTSDHRPVTGLFRIRVKTVDVKRREWVVRQGEERFGQVVKSVSGDVMVDFLVNTLGFSLKDAMVEMHSALGE